MTEARDYHDAMAIHLAEHLMAEGLPEDLLHEMEGTQWPT